MRLRIAKIAFTGTPLLTERHKQKTHERFGGSGEFIDTYKIREAVDDRAVPNGHFYGEGGEGGSFFSASLPT